MSAIRRIAILLVMLSAAALAALPLVASGRNGDSVTKTLTDDDETYVCHIEPGKRLHVVREKDGEEVVDLDLAALNASVNEALDQLRDGLSELDDLDLTIDWSHDGVLNLDVGEDHVSIDVEKILDEVRDAVSRIDLDDLDLGNLHVRWDDDENAASDLEAELQSLRDEIKKLKRELKREQRRARH